jgi:hypothetical protein
VVVRRARTSVCVTAKRPAEINKSRRSPDGPSTFPFSAIVGQDEMKLAILVAAVDPSVGGVLIFGDRGTGKSTAVRALAALLPKMRAVVGCRYGCDPAKPGCGATPCEAFKAHKTALVPVPVVDMPLGATEDRVVGALDIEKALTQGTKSFEPGPAGTCQPRLFLHRRSQPARRPPGGPAHRRGRLGRKRGRA